MTDRTNELRRALVATVEAAPFVPPRRRGMVVAAGIAAFTIAGAVAGVVTATVSQASTSISADQATAHWVLSFARANSQLLGDVIHSDKKGSIELDLGMAPEGATGFVIVSTCSTVGHLDLLVNGEWVGGSDCIDDGATVGGGSAWTQAITGNGNYSLAINTDPGMVHEVWVAWVKEPPLPEQSRQQQAELRDGVVTRQEYVAAFNRFLGCMAAGGYDLGGIEQRDGDVTFPYGIPSAAYEDGTDETCYVREFREVDSTWQVSQE